MDDIGWWTDVYLLTLSSFQLFYGKFYSLFSIKIVYLCAIALFEIGSLICATASNAIALVFGRAIAGLGAAGLFSGGILISTKIIPLAKRAAYLGIMSGVFGLAAIGGPFIGGALTDEKTWRWCFGINLPLGAVTILLCAFLVSTPRELEAQPQSLVRRVQQFDAVGTITMIASIICLLLALQWGGSTYPWSNGRIIVLFVVSGILAIIFVIAQTLPRFGRGQTMPPSLARDRNIWLAASYAMCITGGIYVVVLYLPLWFQAIKGDSALSSGVKLTPLIAGYVVFSVVAGALTSTIGFYNPAMLLGTAIAIIGAALLATIDSTTTIARIVGYQLLYGSGVGLGFGQPSYVIQTLLPSDDIPIGITFITLVQNLSASVFVAVGQSIFQSTLANGLQGIANGFQPPDFKESGAANVLSHIPLQERQKAISAYSDALVKTFYISLALSCFSSIGAMATKWTSMKSGKDELESFSSNKVGLEPEPADTASEPKAEDLRGAETSPTGEIA